MYGGGSNVMEEHRRRCSFCSLGCRSVSSVRLPALLLLLLMFGITIHTGGPRLGSKLMIRAAKMILFEEVK